MIIEGESGGFPVCLAEFPGIVTFGQSVVIGTGLVLGLAALLLYRWRTRRSKYELTEEQE